MINLTSERLLAVIELQNEIAASRFDVDTVLQVVVNRAWQLTNGTGAAVELVEGDEMVYRTAGGTVAAGTGLKLKRSASLSGHCVAKGLPLRSDDTSSDERVDQNACKRIGAASMVCVPLKFHDDPVGVLKVVSSRPFGFDDADVELLKLLARIVGIALRQAEEFAGAIRASTHDALTGLPNRRLFDSRLNGEVLRHARYQLPLCLAMVDLDGFKLANDRLGHAEGDEVLRRVAKLIAKSIREVDMCFRLGEDEFAVLMPSTNAMAAKVAMQRVEKAIEGAALAYGSVTASWGIAELAPSSSPESLLKDADAALYAAKRQKKARPAVQQSRRPMSDA